MKTTKKQLRKLELQKQLMDGVIEAIKAVQSQRVMPKTIKIPYSHKHLIPKNFHTDGLVMHYTEGEACVEADPIYGHVVAAIKLPASE